MFWFVTVAIFTIVTLAAIGAHLRWQDEQRNVEARRQAYEAAQAARRQFEQTARTIFGEKAQTHALLETKLAIILAAIGQNDRQVLERDLAEPRRHALAVVGTWQRLHDLPPISTLLSLEQYAELTRQFQAAYQKINAAGDAIDAIHKAVEDTEEAINAILPDPGATTRTLLETVEEVYLINAAHMLNRATEEGLDVAAIQQLEASLQKARALATQAKELITLKEYISAANLLDDVIGRSREITTQTMRLSVERHKYSMALERARKNVQHGVTTVEKIEQLMATLAESIDASALRGLEIHVALAQQIAQTFEPILSSLEHALNNHDWSDFDHHNSDLEMRLQEVAQFYRIASALSDNAMFALSCVQQTADRALDEIDVLTEEVKCNDSSQVFLEMLAVLRPIVVSIIGRLGSPMPTTGSTSEPAPSDPWTIGREIDEIMGVLLAIRRASKAAKS